MGNDKPGHADDETTDLLGHVVDSDGISEEELLDGEWVLAEDTTDGDYVTDSHDTESDTEVDDSEGFLLDTSGDTDTVNVTEPTDADTVHLLQVAEPELDLTEDNHSTDVDTTIQLDGAESRETEAFDTLDEAQLADTVATPLDPASDMDDQDNSDDHGTEQAAVSLIAAAEPEDADDEVHLFEPAESLFDGGVATEVSSGALADYRHLAEDGDFHAPTDVDEESAPTDNATTVDLAEHTEQTGDTDKTGWTEQTDNLQSDFDEETDPEHTSGEDFLSPDGPEPEDRSPTSPEPDTNVVPLRRLDTSAHRTDEATDTGEADEEYDADSSKVRDLRSTDEQAEHIGHDDPGDETSTAEDVDDWEELTDDSLSVESHSVDSTEDSFQVVESGDATDTAKTAAGSQDDTDQSATADASDRLTHDNRPSPLSDDGALETVEFTHDEEFTAEDTEETTAQHREVELGAGWLSFGRTITRVWGALLVLLVGFGTLAAILALVASPESNGGAQTLPSSAYAEQYKAKIKELGFESAPTVLAVITRDDGSTLKTADEEAGREVARVASLVDRGDVEQPIPPAIVSDDGKAALVRIPFANDLTNDQISEAMDDLIERTGDVTKDVRVEFAGGPAITRDIGQVFKGADVKLLLSTAAIVAILLLLTYRSPILWFFPLFVVVFVDQAASRLAGQLATKFDLVLDGSVLGITQVLVLGAGTNYALLLTSRYREELQQRTDRKLALTRAIAGAGPAIVASNITVVLALMMLLFAVVPASRTLGLVAGTMLLFTMVFVIVLLPAVYAVLPRFVFWPFIPRPDKTSAKPRRNSWERIASWVCSRPLRVLAVSVTILGVLAAGLVGSTIGLKPTEQFTDKPASVKATETLGKHFGQGAGGNIEALVHTDVADELTQKLNQDSRIVGVRQVPLGGPDGQWTKLFVTSNAEPGTAQSLKVAGFVRKRLASWSTPPVYVGGQEIAEMQAREFAQQDRTKIVGLILLVVFLVLIWLLKSLVAPVLLLLATSLSAFAAVGAGVWVSLNVLGYPAIDTGVFLLAFLFLIALGIDYTIFLMDRAKQEASRMSTRSAVVHAVGATGGVITSAGVVLAAVFVVLGVLPLVVLAQLGAIVCIGILLDTFLVRTLVVPALCACVGEGIWWPQRRALASK